MCGGERCDEVVSALTASTLEAEGRKKTACVKVSHRDKLRINSSNLCVMLFYAHTLEEGVDGEIPKIENWQSHVLLCTPGDSNSTHSLPPYLCDEGIHWKVHKIVLGWWNNLSPGVASHVAQNARSQKKKLFETQTCKKLNVQRHSAQVCWRRLVSPE